MNQRRVVILALVPLFALSFLVAACAPPAPTPPAAAPAAPAAPAPKAITKIKLVVPQKDAMATGGFYAIATNKGYLKDEGLEVEPVYTRGGAEQVQVVVSGEVPIALQTGIASVMGAFVKGAPVTIISSADIGSPSVIWYVKADSPIKGWKKELAGKKVGYSRPGSGSHMAVLDLIDYYKTQGWTPPPVAVSTGGMPDTLAATLTGQIDVGWTGYPVNMDQFEKRVIRDVFRPMRDLAGWDNLVVRVNFANSNWLDKNREVARAFLRAWKRATDFSYENPREAFLFLSGFVGTPMESDFVISKYEEYQPRASQSLAPRGSYDLAMKQAIMGKFIERPLTKAEMDKLFPLAYIPK